MAATPSPVRSVHELRFALESAGCPSCGGHDIADLRVLGATAPDPRVVTATWRCRWCGAPGARAVRADRDLLRDPPPPGHLGGRAPTAALTPRELLAELDRAETMLAGDPASLAPAPWRRLAAANTRAVTCGNELLKFPDDALPLPREAIELRHAANRVRADLLTADAPRIWAMEPPAPAPRGAMSPLDLERHRRWVAAGATGEGGLDVADLVADGLDLTAAELSGAVLRRVRLQAARLTAARLRGARLEGVDLLDAVMDRADLSGARLEDCRVDGAAAPLTVLEGTALRRCALRGADLSRSAWSGAVVVGCTLREARLAEASFTGAVMEECDLRGAVFAVTSPGIAVRTELTLVRCDLRGAVWEGRDRAGLRLVDCRED